MRLDGAVMSDVVCDVGVIEKSKLQKLIYLFRCRIINECKADGIRCKVDKWIIFTGGLMPGWHKLSQSGLVIVESGGQGASVIRKQKLLRRLSFALTKSYKMMAQEEYGHRGSVEEYWAD